MKVDNSKGQIFYGMHFYPGVAEYQEPGKEPYRVFLNENTIRQMDPTFAGRPVFVPHVDEVDDDLDLLKNDADGWVVESFYNAADGKHWAKFIVVSKRGLDAVRRGFHLSNSYFPKSFGDGGLWNGVQYSKEVTSGEYEHLALVDDPRYNESIVMTPEEFKAYNNEKTIELGKIANSKKQQKENNKMGFTFWKKTKVDNSTDLEGMIVTLPKSKKSLSVEKILNEYDKIVNMHGYANEDHLVKLNDDEMSVKDLVKKHNKMCQEMEDLKKKNAETEEGGEPGKGADDDKAENDGDEKDDPSMENEALDIDDMGDVGDRGGDKHLGNPDESDLKEDHDSLENEEDEEAEKKAKEAKEKDKKSNEAKAAAAKKEEAKKKAAALRNAHLNQFEEEAKVKLGFDQVARGKARYGSK